MTQYNDQNEQVNTEALYPFDQGEDRYQSTEARFDDIIEYVRKTDVEKFDDMPALCQGSTMTAHDLRYGYVPGTQRSLEELCTLCPHCQHIISVYYEARVASPLYQMRYHDVNGKHY